MDEVKWYENNSLESIKNIIRDNISTVSRSFNAIGYYLKNVRDRNLHIEAGYNSILEFAHKEFNISESWANRWMNINDRFSVNGNSPMLQEEYKNFDKSILAEMLTLSDAQLEQVALTTTRAEIRNIKRESKEQKKSLAPAQVEPEKSVPSSSHGFSTTDMQKSITDQELESIDFSRSIDSLAKEYEAKGSCPKGVGGCMRNGEEGEAGKKICTKCWKEWLSKEKILVEAKALREQEPLENMNDTQDTENDNTDSMDDKVDTPERACSNCKYNILPREDYFKEYPDTDQFPCDKCDGDLDNWIPDTGIVNQEVGSAVEQEPENAPSEFPCDTCRYENSTGCCDYDSEDDYCVLGDKWKPKCSEEPEIVEADVIYQTDPEKYSIADIQGEIREHTNNLDILRKDNTVAPIRYKSKMRLDAATALLDKLSEPEAEELPEVIQPELPILKNNDQRKDFIDNYNSWPIWIDQELTGERYYRYDFEDGTSFVIRVSLQHAYKGYERIAEIKYGHEEYFLLGVKNRWIPGMPTFTESSTNKSAMIDHLKEIQKKGAKA